MQRLQDAGPGAAAASSRQGRGPAWPRPRTQAPPLPCDLLGSQAPAADAAGAWTWSGTWSLCLRTAEQTRSVLQELPSERPVEVVLPWTGTRMEGQLAALTSSGRSESSARFFSLCRRSRMFWSQTVLRRWCFTLFLLCSPVPLHGRPVDGASGRT